MQIMNGKLPLFWDATLLAQGCRLPVWWNYLQDPHIMCIGPTGKGKTYAVKLVLARISKYIPDAKIYVDDFKACGDYAFLRGCSGFYEFMDCKQGLDDFYNAFLARMQGNNPDRSFRLMMFDEWASFVNTLDKKEAETAKKQLSTLLMLGRGYNFHVLIVQQRADAQYFSTARDNFSEIITLGNISRESSIMLGFDRDKLQPVSGIGAGYMLTNGVDLQKIQVPVVRDTARLEGAIRSIVG